MSRMILAFMVLSWTLGAAQASAQAQAAPTAPPAAAKKDSKTNVSFDDLLIQGKYHFSDEVVITVEDDKVLDGLLGVRKDFKDRIEQSASRN